MLKIGFQHRSFGHLSSPRLMQVVKPRQALALKTEIREREVHDDKATVGDVGKGAEGLHYQGMWFILNQNCCSGQDESIFRSVCKRG